MKEYIKRCQDKVNDIQFILLLVLISFLIQIPMRWVLFWYLDNGGYYSGPNIYNVLNDIYAVTLGPVIESAMIVAIIWVVENKIHIKKKVHILMITALIFALFHTYSISYMIGVFPLCIIIVYSYMYYKPKKLSSFEVMLWVHILNNLVSVLMSILF